jgi:hypothetical protein
MFGLSASMLIASLWGSAAVGSRDTVAEVIQEVSGEQVVQERFVGWVVEGLDSVDVLATGASRIGDRLLAEPETQEVLTRLSDQVVNAVFAPAGSTAWVDPAAALLPSLPQLTRVLVEERVVADENTVAALVATIEPIPLDGGGELSLTGSATQVSAALSLAAVLAGLLMMIAGVGAVLISVDRLGAVRHLAYRLMLTSLSFSVLLSLGSWLADPAGGATPWRSGLSALLGSHLYVPLLWVGLAALISVGVFWEARRRSNAGTERANSGI